MFRLLALIHLLYRKMCYFLAYIIALPFITLGWISDRIKGEITQPSIVISRIPFYIGETARRFYYKALLLSVGSKRHI